MLGGGCGTADAFAFRRLRAEAPLERTRTVVRAAALDVAGAIGPRVSAPMLSALVLIPAGVGEAWWGVAAGAGELGRPAAPAAGFLLHGADVSAEMLLPDGRRRLHPIGPRPSAAPTVYSVETRRDRVTWTVDGTQVHYEAADADLPPLGAVFLAPPDWFSDVLLKAPPEL